MRTELKKVNQLRLRFIATFVRFGSKKAFKGPPIKTLLFQNIRNSKGQKYCDHLWFTINQTFERLNLQPGEEICFDARVRLYTKGYKGNRDQDYDDTKPISTDYKLSHPTNVVKHQGTGTPGLLF